MFCFNGMSMHSRINSVCFSRLKTHTYCVSIISFSDVDILEKLSDSWPAKCTHVVKEVIVTERAYVQSLTDVIKVSMSDNMRWCIHDICHEC